MKNIMNRRNPVRYDPLYRVIDETDEMRFIEGTFKELFDNLKGINNLGIIPEVLEMAKYSKYEHHSGVMYQINSLLECVDKEMIPERYRLPLKLSALLLHVGHLPFTYSTERSLLVAANLSDKVKDAIEKKIQKVLKESGFKAKKKKKHFEALFSLKKYKVIYKYFSAYEVIDNWGKLKNKYSLIDIKKRVIINNMIDYEDSDGYNFLLLVDKADFVQRDALYFGTARIDISPKHLYGRSLVKLESEFSVDEKNLIESNLRYLKGRFYEDYEVRWFTRLYEKIVASLIISNNFKLDWLKEFNDLEFKELITENITPQNRKAGLPPTWTERAMALFKRKIQFSLIFNLSEISFENQSGIDLEYKLLQKDPSKRGVLSYPFDKGILLDIDYNEETKYPIYSDSQSFSVGVFQDTSNKKFIELLKIVKQLSYYCSISHVDNIRKGLCRQFSWTGSARIDNDAVIEVIAKVIQNIEKSPQEKGKFMENFFTNILEIKTFDELWHNFENSFIWLGEIKQLRKAKYLFDSYKLLVKGILNGNVALVTTAYYKANNK